MTYLRNRLTIIINNYHNTFAVTSAFTSENSTAGSTASGEGTGETFMNNTDRLLSSYFT